MKIGVIGLAGAGKDTFAEAVADALAEMVHITRYAAPLKAAAECVFGPKFDQREVKEVPVYLVGDAQDRMLEATFQMCRDLGFDSAQMEKAGELYAETLGLYDYISPRKYQQLAGTEVVRAVQEDAFIRNIKNTDSGPYDLIVPDVRFENELLDVNVLVIRNKPAAVAVHPSEQFAADLTSEFLLQGGLPSQIAKGRHIFVLQNSGDKSGFEKAAVGLYQWITQHFKH